MGRGRTPKGKKLSIANNHDDPGSGEEEKIPAQKRRGRPQKPLKDDIDEADVAKIEVGDTDLDKNKHNTNNKKSNNTAKESSAVTAATASAAAGGENGKKRKRNVQAAKEKSASTQIKDGNGVVVSTTTITSTSTTTTAAAAAATSTTTTTSANDDSIKTTNGFRHIGSRRKNKPRRAAEVGVECN